MKLLVNWLFSAVALMIVAHLVHGFYVANFVSALVAAVIVGLVNATLGWFLKIITFPFTIVTLGLFWIVINALMLELVAAFVPGFHIASFGPAFFGAIVLSIVNLIFRQIHKQMFKED